MPNIAVISMDNYNDGSKVVDSNFDGEWRGSCRCFDNRRGSCRCFDCLVVDLLGKGGGCKLVTDINCD